MASTADLEMISTYRHITTRINKDMEARDFYTIEEIATQLRVKVSAVRGRLSQDDPTLPPSVRLGGRRLFPAAAYEEWKRNLLKATASAQSRGPASESSTLEPTSGGLT